jgi:hypothetical protein
MSATAPGWPNPAYDDEGERAGYRWLSRSSPIEGLPDLVRRHHPGRFLAIAAFDSGPIRPSPTEIEAGWTVQGSLMISPPLTESLEIPYDDWDEWYLVDRPHLAIAQPEFFVNLSGFTLVDPAELVRRQDPTWDRKGHDWLIPLQERFWEQLLAIGPISYIAMSEVELVVSRDPAFIDRARAVA